MNSEIHEFEPLWGQWKVDSLIGEGSFGRVYKVSRQDFGRTYYSAVKHISIPQNQSQADMALEEGYGTDHETLMDYFRDVVSGIVSEIEIMNKLQGDSHIVSYADHLIVEKKDGIGWDILIRMELLTPLSKYFSKKTYSVQDVVKIGIDICLGLERCQKSNLIHRDIKPSNIFVSENGDFKLGDFGISRQIEKTTLGLSRKGTPLYMAPEVYLGSAYNSSVDTYSLAIVLYRYFNNNRLPFVHATGRFTQEDNEKALDRRINGETLPAPINADARLSEIISKACAYSPKERYESARAFRTDLEGFYALIHNDAPIAISNINSDTDNKSIDNASQISLSQSNQFESQKSNSNNSEQVISTNESEGTVGLFNEARPVSAQNSYNNNQTNTDTAREGTVGVFGASLPIKEKPVQAISSPGELIPDVSEIPVPVEKDTKAADPIQNKIKMQSNTSRKYSRRKKMILFLVPFLIIIMIVSGFIWAKLPRTEKISILLTTTTSELNKGETFQLRTMESENQTLVWESSDPKIAVVDENGKVTGKAPGEVTIWVSALGSELKTPVNIVILPVLENIMLNKESTAILIGGQEKLVVRSDPQEIELPKLVWESSNPSIATVDKTGLIMALAEGKTEITVKDIDGKFTAKCQVSVQITAIEISGIEINPASLTLNIGQTSSLLYTITPSDATTQLITWVSSNPAIVSVNTDGVVKAIGAGDATITVQTKDGNIKSLCQIKVAAPTPTPSPTPTIKPTNKPATQATTQAPPAATWSEWALTLPSGVTSSNYTIESKTQYRSKKLSSQTSAWSAWQTTEPTGTNITVEKQYQVRGKSYTTSTSPVMDGWTQYGSPTVTYGAWSGWSTNAATASATLEVQSKDVAVMTYKTVYNYNSWTYVNGGLTYYSYASGWGGIPGTWLYKTVDSPLAQTGTYDGHPGYGSGGVIWFNQSTSQAEAGNVYHKEYQTRTITTTYNYWQWGAWSAWTAGSYSGSTTDTEVNYQYRFKTTTSSWSDWTAWSSTAVTASSTVQVESRTLYRCIKK